MIDVTFAPLDDSILVDLGPKIILPLFAFIVISGIRYAKQGGRPIDKLKHTMLDYLLISVIMFGSVIFNMKSLEPVLFGSIFTAWIMLLMALLFGVVLYSEQETEHSIELFAGRSHNIVRLLIFISLCTIELTLTSLGMSPTHIISLLLGLLILIFGPVMYRKSLWKLIRHIWAD